MIAGVPVLEEMEQALELLRKEVTANQERIRILEPAVAALRKLAGGPRPSRIPRALKEDLEPAGDRRKDGRSEPDWGKGRRLWDDGKRVPDIAEAIGVTPASVYSKAKRDTWPARKP